jgi:hypothetical protein
MCPVRSVTYVSGRSQVHSRICSRNPFEQSPRNSALPLLQDSGFRSCLLSYFGSSIQMLPVVSAYSYTMDLPSGAQSG